MFTSVPSMAGACPLNASEKGAGAPSSSDIGFTRSTSFACPGSEEWSRYAFSSQRRTTAPRFENSTWYSLVSMAKTCSWPASIWPGTLSRRRLARREWAPESGSPRMSFRLALTVFAGGWAGGGAL